MHVLYCTSLSFSVCVFSMARQTQVMAESEAAELEQREREMRQLEVGRQHETQHRGPLPLSHPLILFFSLPPSLTLPPSLPLPPPSFLTPSIPSLPPSLPHPLPLCTHMITPSGPFIFVCLLQTDIVDINDIFRDLATMVHDQGELVGRFYHPLCSL